MNKSIAIVIPSYNEASNIDVLIQALNETILNINYNFKFIFVDDGSNDETVAVLKEYFLFRIIQKFRTSKCPKSWDRFSKK